MSALCWAWAGLPWGPRLASVPIDCPGRDPLALHFPLQLQAAVTSVGLLQSGHHLAVVQTLQAACTPHQCHLLWGDEPLFVPGNSPTGFSSVQVCRAFLFLALGWGVCQVKQCLNSRSVEVWQPQVHRRLWGRASGVLQAGLPAFMNNDKISSQMLLSVLGLD